MRAVATALVVLLVAPGALAAAAPDWMLATLVLPRDSRDPVVRVDGAGGRVADEPLVLGVGIAAPGSSRVTVTERVGDAVVASSVGDVWVRLVAPNTGAAGHGAAVRFVGNWSAGAEFRLLLFVTGGDLAASTTADAYDGQGDLPVDLATGDGSRAIVMAAPDDEGASVRALTVGAGATLAAHAPEAGIVGASAVTGCIGSCVAFWTSPDGREGTAATFAGPAGAWTFVGGGARTPDVVAAYAPIGDAWTAFD